jgi:hypothetical protein
MANQLRSHLQTTVPGAVGLFRDIDSSISLRFQTRFPCQDKADWLSPARLENWLRAAGYNNPSRAGVLHAHLATGAGPGTTGRDGVAWAAVTLPQVSALSAAREQIEGVSLDTVIRELELMAVVRSDCP